MTHLWVHVGRYTACLKGRTGAERVVGWEARAFISVGGWGVWGSCAKAVWVNLSKTAGFRSAPQGSSPNSAQGKVRGRLSLTMAAGEAVSGIPICL